MKFAITGGSGFIGSNLVKYLLNEGHDISVLDPIQKNAQTKLKEILHLINYKIIDFENIETVKSELKNFDVVIHLAASANTAIGQIKTNVDLKQGIITTYNLLEAMRLNGIKNIIFTSAPAVYGNPFEIPTREDTGMLFPISLYGAAKLASEGMISAFCHIFEMKSWIFRLGNVVGPNMTRGVIQDFILKLKKDSTKLEILGNGEQKKDVIFVNDCIKGIFYGFEKSSETVNVFNLSSGSTITVNEIASIIQKEMSLKNVNLKYRGGKGGWPGDPPIINLDVSKLESLGWKPEYNSHEAVKLTVRGILQREINR